MNNFFKILVGLKDKLFSIGLIVLGLLLTIKAFSINPVTGLSQTWQFKIASVTIILLGALSLYFVINKKRNKIIGLLTNLALIVGIGFFGWMNVSSIKNKIAQQEAIKISKKLAIQGLGDIQKIAKAYDRKYQKNASSFDELIKFAKFDSITRLTKAHGDIKKGKMSPADAKSLGLRFAPEVTTEKQAIALGWIVREYEKIPVFNHLFSPEKLKRTVREYDFDINKLKSYRTYDMKKKTILDNEKQFNLKTAIVDSVIYLQIMAYPPYGPQALNEIKDTIRIGSLVEKSIKPSW